MQWVIANWILILGILAICTLAIIAYVASEMSGQEGGRSDHGHGADDKVAAAGAPKRREGHTDNRHFSRET